MSRREKDKAKNDNEREIEIERAIKGRKKSFEIMSLCKNGCKQEKKIKLNDANTAAVASDISFIK